MFEVVAKEDAVGGPFADPIRAIPPDPLRW